MLIDPVPSCQDVSTISHSLFDIFLLMPHSRVNQVLKLDVPPFISTCALACFRNDRVRAYSVDE